MQILPRIMYENAQYLYVPEIELLCSHVRKAIENGTELDWEAIADGMHQIRERYFATPYAKMAQAKRCRSFSEITHDAAKIVADMKL